MLRIKSPARSLCAALLAAGVSVGACGGDDEVTTSGGPGKKDAAGGAGGVFGSGGGSFGTSGDSGASGASGASGNAGNAGFSGNGGVAGTGSGGVSGSGPDASVGGTAGGGTCNPQFCPNTGMGSPCCVTAQGPCGMNYGSGCMGDPGGNRG
jgi:hypothetical protein